MFFFDRYQNRAGASSIFQLKKHTRFIDFVMVVWVQGSIFHTAAVSLHVQ